MEKSDPIPLIKKVGRGKTLSKSMNYSEAGLHRLHCFPTIISLLTFRQVIINIGDSSAMKNACLIEALPDQQLGNDPPCYPRSVFSFPPFRKRRLP